MKSWNSYLIIRSFSNELVGFGIRYVVLGIIPDGSSGDFYTCLLLFSELCISGQYQAVAWFGYQVTFYVTFVSHHLQYDSVTGTKMKICTVRAAVKHVATELCFY